MHWDLESTGLGHYTEEIVEYAIESHEHDRRLYDPNVSGSKPLSIASSQYIYTERPFQEKAKEITGLDTEKLRLMYKEGSAVRRTEGLAKFLSDIRSLDEPVVMVAWNGHRFDVPLMLAELRREYKDVRRALLDSNIIGFYDAKMYAKDNLKNTMGEDKMLLTAKGVPDYSLGPLYHAIFGEPFDNAHEAMADTSAMREVCEHEYMSGMYDEGWRESKYYMDTKTAVNKFELARMNWEHRKEVERRKKSCASTVPKDFGDLLTVETVSTKKKRARDTNDDTVPGSESKRQKV